MYNVQMDVKLNYISVFLSCWAAMSHHKFLELYWRDKQKNFSLFHKWEHQCKTFTT